jgi:branched-chain amino acid transport system ATP-binding protein
VMNEGRKIAEGTPAQVAGNAEVVAAYLGAKRAAA